MTVATLNDQRYFVVRELKRIFAWEIAIHSPHNGQEGCMWLGQYWDVHGNTGEGLADYSITKLYKRLRSEQWPSYPDGEAAGCEYHTESVHNVPQVCDPHPRAPQVVCDERYTPPWELLDGCDADR